MRSAAAHLIRVGSRVRILMLTTFDLDQISQL
jgi:hypothetical protein